jgi:oxygen-independent coproporphyrinogen-3 oxidase
LHRRAPAFSGNLASIYFGGGTPSLWRPDCIAGAIRAVQDQWGQPIEVTLEANPTDCDEVHLAAWRDAGVNRLSIGVQSLEPGELVTLGRDHRFGDGMAAVERARSFGGFTVTADFILGVPPQRMPDWRPLADVEHLSVYELTIEDRTAFGQRVKTGRLVPLDDDALVELYTATHDALTALGFEHYEISSYAKPGRRAVHNSLYWRGEPFLGLGVGAASLALRADGSGERATNVRKARDYLAGAAPETISITPAEMANDRAWLGMRTSDGVLEAQLQPNTVTWLLAEGLADRRGERICPTLRGFLMADRIAARIVDAL